MNTAHLVGTGSYLPGNVITTEELNNTFGKSCEWLSEVLKNDKRYYAIDLKTGSLLRGLSNSEMMRRAATRAIENANMTPQDIELIITTTGTPDYLLPSCAPLVQEKLSIKECASIELRGGCGAMAQAFAIATNFLETGIYKTALLIGCDIASSYYFNPTVRKSYHNSNVRDFLPLLMFSDGAGAFVLKSRNGKRLSDGGVIKCKMNSIGTGLNSAYMIDGFGSNDPFPIEKAQKRKLFLYNYKEQKKLFNYLKRKCFEDLEEIISVDNVNWFVIPGINIGFLKSKYNDTFVPEDRLFSNSDKVGNTVSASIYIAVDEMNRTNLIKKGDTLVLMPSDGTKLMYGVIAINWSI